MHSILISGLFRDIIRYPPSPQMPLFFSESSPCSRVAGSVYRTGIDWNSKTTLFCYFASDGEQQRPESLKQSIIYLAKFCEMSGVSSSSEGSLKLWYPVALRNRIINKMFHQIRADGLSWLSNILEALCFDFLVDSLCCQAHRKMQHKNLSKSKVWRALRKQIQAWLLWFKKK